VVVDNRGDNRLLVSSTHPVWTRKLVRLEEAQGLAVRTRPITAVENVERRALGGEWGIEGALLALRLTPRRKASEAQKAAAARARNARLRSESSAPAEIPDDNESGSAPPTTRSSRLTRRREPPEES
jgi:hypothetical protein